MLKFEWNALRGGHREVVHDQVGSEFARLPGTVAMLETKRGEGSANGWIRVAASGGGSRIVWPSYLAAHHDPPDPSDDCWRSATLADTGARHLVASAQPHLVAAR